MAIEKMHKIVYQDLVDYALNLIKNSCWNINSTNSTSWSSYTPYNSSKTAPTQLRNGYVKTLSSYSVSEKKVDARHTQSIAVPNCTISYQSTISDNILVPVYQGTIDTQFNSFLTSKGIVAKKDEVVSFKGMLNFMNNLAVFMAAKLVHVVNSVDKVSQVYYMSSGSANTTLNTISDNNLSNSDVKTNLQQIMAAICNVTRVHYANSVISYACSSSSSSSSSSCSSSSSSSSSSMFIAYMQI